MAIDRFPIGRDATLHELVEDPHPLLARLRAAEPVSWLPVLGGWLVTRYDLAVRVMRDHVTFTVDDPRFSTAQVVGPSMLSLDGAHHARLRQPFAQRADIEAVEPTVQVVEQGRDVGEVSADRVRRQVSLEPQVPAELGYHLVRSF